MTNPVPAKQSILACIEDLETHYGKALERSLYKELDYIPEHYAAFIRATPFVVLATSGPDGLDCSPRGDPAGFLRIIDKNTIHLPDRRGNNRVDTLRNLVVDPRISLLCIIPGIGETLRIIGSVKISIDANLCELHAMQGKAAKAVLIIDVEKIYFQCQKALHRSRFWDIDTQIDRALLPSAGDMTKANSPIPFDAEAYDRDYPEYMKKTIY